MLSSRHLHEWKSGRSCGRAPRHDTAGIAESHRLFNPALAGGAAILYLRFAASLAVAAQDSRPSGSLLPPCKALSSSTFMPVYPGAQTSPLHSFFEQFRMTRIESIRNLSVTNYGNHRGK